ncbi:hypothetical protein [Parvibaculum sp.]|uniref:hypothetical protein n=1 Tax=Parvibaculum sp. TaxID=2024848 RepID=UPI001DBD7ACA|nr:hypothetical protein [Parvibaculum sp.]MBX3490899.1 hypothetical protein [Parvibaculum sp.]
MNVAQADHRTVSLPPYSALTVIADALSRGSVVRLADSMGGEPQGVTPIANDETVVIGPFGVQTRHDIVCSNGALTYGMAPVDFPTLTEAVAASLAAAAGAHLSVVDTAEAIASVAEIIGEGAPDASLQATIGINPAGDDNALTFTAVEFGAGGDEVAIAYVDPETAESPLSVAVVGKQITVSLETDDSEPPEIVSTAADILAAIEAEEAAAALVTVAIDVSDSGSEDDGSGVVTAMESTALEGGAGVGVGVAGRGSRYTDITNGALYLNVGDADEPDWSMLAFD